MKIIASCWAYLKKAWKGIMFYFNYDAGWGRPGYPFVVCAGGIIVSVFFSDENLAIASAGFGFVTQLFYLATFFSCQHGFEKLWSGIKFYFNYDAGWDRPADVLFGHLIGGILAGIIFPFVPFMSWDFGDFLCVALPAIATWQLFLFVWFIVSRLWDKHGY